MRKTKTVELDGRKITVKELRLKDIRLILEIAEKEDEDLLRQAERLLPLAADLDLEDFDEMAPSEIRVVWEAFREVNADFLSLTERLGVGRALGDFLRKHLTDALSDLSNGDT